MSKTAVQRRIDKLIRKNHDLARQIEAQQRENERLIERVTGLKAEVKTLDGALVQAVELAEHYKKTRVITPNPDRYTVTKGEAKK